MARDVRPARPLGGRPGAPPLRLVAGSDATPQALVEEAREAEARSRADDARELYERALQGCRAPDDAPVAAVALLAIARLAHASGESGVALDVLDAARASAAAYGSEADLARAATLRARVLWDTGDAAGAEREAARATDWARRAGDGREAAAALSMSGALAVARGALDDAIARYEESLSELRALGHVTEMSGTLISLAEILDDARRWDDADATLREAVSVATALGDRDAVLDAELRHAELLAHRGDGEGAQAAADRAADVARRLRDPRALAATARTQAMVARERGDFARAEERLAAAEAAARDVTEPALEAELAAERAELFHRLERHRETIVALNRAHRALSQLRGSAPMADLARRTRRLEAQFVDVVRRWGQSIEAKDLNTHGHCERVADLACTIAQRMGAAPSSLFWYRVGALLHDIGKLVVPAELLNKPGRLTESEWALVRQHPTAGAEMLADVDFPWDVRPIVECHHECWDGSGYPHGLAGERIPLAARIVCVADVYDVLTSDRSFKRALSHEDALDVMRRDVGRQFDPAVFRVFEEVIDEWARPPAEQPARPAPAAVTPRVIDATGPQDGLTGVLSRHAFLSVVADTLARRTSTDRPVSLVLFDIDELSRVNDAYGQLQGDDVLWAVARVMHHGLRGGDVVGRYGGDEFAVLLPGATLDVAREVARRLQAGVARLRSPVRADPDTTMGVTVSAGVASAPAHASAAEPLVASADRALFVARRGGANSLATADDAALRPSIPRLDLDRFVGRVDELRKLAGWVDAAARGDGRFVMIAGEAGVGKSTLVRQLEPEVRVRAGVLAVGRSAASTVKAPFGAWAEIVAAIHAQGATPAGAWDALHRIVPALGATTTAAPGEESPYALLEQLAAYLRGAAATRPLVVVLEDVQWADRATWDGMEFVASQLRGAPLLVCATIRAEEARDVADRRRRLARSPGFAQISLRRLTRDELKRWLETVFHQGDIGTELPTFLHRYTEGNPLLVAQVLRALVDDGGVWYAGTRWEWRPLDQLQLPPSCAQIVGRRIERLSPRAAVIVSCAALLGRPFDADLLVAAGAGSAEAVQGALAEAVTAAVLVQADRSHAPEYDFAHAVLADAARASIPDRARAAMHHRVAQALELRAPTAVAEIARHYHAAGDDVGAYRYAMLAADRAASVHAHDEASACLAVAQRHAPSPDELAAARIRNAIVAESAGRLDQAEELCDLVLDHVVDSRDTTRTILVRRIRERLRARRGQPPRRTLDACSALLAEAEMSDSEDEATALHIMISEAHSALGDADAAERSARRAVRLSAAHGDRRAHADALLRLGASLSADRLEETLDRYREALALHIRLSDKHGQTRCWLATGNAHATAGRSSAAREAYEVALENARQAHAPDLAAVACFALGTADYRLGTIDRARDHLDEALRLFTSVRDERRRTAVLLMAAHTARAAGQLQEALAGFDAVVLRARDLGDELTEAIAEAGAGHIKLDGGDTDAGAQRLSQAEALLAGAGTTGWFAGREVIDALAIRLATTAGHSGLAAERFADALTLAEPNDAFAVAFLAAECAAGLAACGVRALESTIERVRYVALASGFDRLAERLSDT